MTLTLLFVALSGVIEALIYLLFPTLSVWWRFPILLSVYVVIGLIYLAVIILCILLAPQGRSRRHATLHGWIRLTVEWILLMVGYRIRLTGADKLPDVPFLLVCNHLSAFDPLCTLAVLGHDMVFVAKPGVFKIPVIGALIRRLGFMPIDRENARNAVTTIKQAAHCITDDGLSVGIYPEGTRSKSGTLLPFHAGSFKIAALAKCPVAVASIRYEKRPLSKQVDLHIVDVMDTDYVTDHNTAAMAERAVTAITAKQ